MSRIHDVAEAFLNCGIAEGAELVAGCDISKRLINSLLNEAAMHASLARDLVNGLHHVPFHALTLVEAEDDRR